MRSPLSRYRAFTLVEILIVVVILGILAAIVIPQFGSAASDSRAANIQTQLASIRGAIEVFKGQHNDQPPLITGMWTLLTSSSDTTETATSAPTGTRWGPYLQAAPVNPLNGESAVSSVSTDTTSGWYYQPAGIGFTFEARQADGSINTTY